MVHLPPAILPAVLLGVTGALATDPNTHTLAPNTTTAASISHQILYSGDTTITATATTTTTAVPEHASTNPAPDADADADTDTEGFFDAVQHDTKRCRRENRRCDCSQHLNATELAALNARRAAANCPKCMCVNGQRVSGAEGGPAGAGQLVKGVAAALVGVAGVMGLV